MPETLLFIGPKSAKALIDELQRRVEPLLRGRWVFEQMLVEPLRSGRLGKADDDRLMRRVGKKDAPLPVVVWPEGRIEEHLLSLISPHSPPDVSRPSLQKMTIPEEIYEILWDRRGVSSIFVELSGAGVKVHGVGVTQLHLHQDSWKYEESAWTKCAAALAEAIQQEMKRPLKSAEIHAFGPFDELKLTFCSGVNVLIGKNSTGKSWLMKLLYGALRATPPDGDGLSVDERLKQRLARLYRPDDGRVGRLVKRGKGRGQAKVLIKQPYRTLNFSISTRDQLKVLDTEDDDFASASWDTNPGSPVYLPSRDALALYEGFIAAYERRELSFDETVYDLCVALSAAPLRGPRSDFAKSTLDELERTLGGSIRLKGNRFYLVSNAGQGDLEAHLLSEGLRKVGTLAQLITNGTLQRGSILFWDEPEANLNPRLIAQMAEVLRQLADLGVQVFLATHDYLLTQRLSMEVEYKRTKVPLRFISLYRDEDGEIRADQADTLVGLEHNDIQEEFRLLYEHELNLAAGVNEEGGA